MHSTSTRPTRRVDRILKGATPATRPVEECTRFRVVNLKAARALGVHVPKAVLSRAEEIID